MQDHIDLFIIIQTEIPPLTLSCINFLECFVIPSQPEIGLRDSHIDSKVPPKCCSTNA